MKAAHINQIQIYVAAILSLTIDGVTTNDGAQFQNQKEMNDMISTTPSQNKDNSISTLQWAVKLNLELDVQSNSSEYLVKELADALNLNFHGSIGGINNWFVVSHARHTEVHASLFEIHDTVRYSPNGTSREHWAKGKNYPLNLDHTNNTSSFLVQQIREIYKDTLLQKHGIDDAQLQQIVDTTERELWAHPHVKHFIAQRVKLRSKRSIHFDDPAFSRQWHLVSDVCSIALS